MLIEMITSGPTTEHTWLLRKADGWTWRLFWYRTEPPEPQTTYRVDVLDEKGTTVLYSEEAEQPTKYQAILWAEHAFVMVLMANDRFPKPGVVVDADNIFLKELPKYRRE
jgi:hypothetical protein